LRRQAEERFNNWPSAQDNALLRMARRRLLGGAKPGAVRGAMAQMGLLQILRDFCDHSNAVCENCAFPELVRNWDIESGLASRAAQAGPAVGAVSPASKLGAG